MHSFWQLGMHSFWQQQCTKNGNNDAQKMATMMHNFWANKGVKTQDSKIGLRFFSR